MTFGAVLVLPLYALVRATPLWWLFAWILFAAVTVIGVMAAPLTARAQFGPLSPTSPLLADRIRTLGRRAGVEISDGATGGVAVAGKAGSDRCNAYVVGLGPTRRVVLEHSVTEWPPEVVDQVVAHEIGHWRLGHTARRLPAIVAQLATFAFAGWLLTRPVLLDWAGVAGLGDPRSYALFLLLTPALALPARCLLAWRDRAQERAADEFALSLLRAPEHFTAMLDRAADEGGAPRQLAPWRRLTASHPSIDERALLCTRFASTA